MNLLGSAGTGAYLGIGDSPDTLRLSSRLSYLLPAGRMADEFTE